MFETPKCISCGAHAPNTDTSYTLISATFGWRLTRRVFPDGSRGVEWRCAKCWDAHKNVAPPTPNGAFGVRPIGRPRPAAGVPASRLEAANGRGRDKPSSPPGAH